MAITAKSIRGLACILSLAGLPAFAAADQYAWATAFDSGANQFDSVDLTTGASTVVGMTPFQLAGLAEIGSTVYAAKSATGIDCAIYTVNTSTAALTTIGTASAGLIFLGSTTTGLYAMDLDGNLFGVNPTTGASTLIGNTGIYAVVNGFTLSVGGANLYFMFSPLSGIGEDLAEVNTTNGSLTVLGLINIDNPRATAMSYQNGVWYLGTFNSPYEVESLSISTLAATPVSQTPGVIQYLGMAPAATPEPAPIVAIGLGLAGALLRRKKSRS